MRHLYLPFLMLILMILEGVGVNVFPFVFWDSQATYIPHWTLVMLIMIAIFYDQEDTYFSIIYALIFGMLIDIVYTGILGVYMFAYAITIYIVHIFRNNFQDNIYITLLISLISIALADIMIHIIYYTIGKTALVWDEYLFLRLIPTLIVNIVFFLLIYAFFKKQLVRWKTPS